MSLSDKINDCADALYPDKVILSSDVKEAIKELLKSGIETQLEPKLFMITPSKILEIFGKELVE